MSKKAANANRVAVWIALATAISASANADDIHQGKIIAEKWCAACHYIDGRRHATDAAPPFAQMANDPAYTETRLRNWLTEPHPPMPKLDLDRFATDDIVAYIRSLKN